MEIDKSIKEVNNNITNDNSLKLYIGKLIDRNLQRKRESGFTIYALYALLILVVYKIFENYPTIPFKDNTTDILKVIAITCSIIYFIFMLYLIFAKSEGDKISLRLINLKTRINNPVFILLDNMLLVIPFTLSLIAFCICLSNHGGGIEYFFFPQHGIYYY